MNKISNNEKTFDFFSFDYDEEKKLTSVHFLIPLQIKFFHEPSGEEIYRQLAEHFRVSISTLARFMSVESVEMLMEYSGNDLQVQNTAAMFQQLADYINAYTNLLEKLERHRPEILEINLKSLDLSNQSESADYLASQISQIMNNPDLPKSVFNAIAYEMTDKPLGETFAPETYTTENVLRNLQNLRDQ